MGMAVPGVDELWQVVWYTRQGAASFYKIREKDALSGLVHLIQKITVTVRKRQAQTLSQPSQATRHPETITHSSPNIHPRTKLT